MGTFRRGRLKDMIIRGGRIYPKGKRTHPPWKGSRTCRSWGAEQEYEQVGAYIILRKACR